MSTAEELTMEMVKKIGLLEAKYYGIFHVDMNGGLPCTSFEDLKISKIPWDWLFMFFFALWKENLTNLLRPISIKSKCMEIILNYLAL